LDDESVAGREADAASVEHGVDDGVRVEVDDLDVEAVGAVELGDVCGGAAGHNVRGYPRGAPASGRRFVGLFALGHDGVIGAGRLIDKRRRCAERIDKIFWETKAAA
jgi:hypothetical protein